MLLQQLEPEIFAEIKRLHFLSLRLANETAAGAYKSAFRGQGMEFEEVREYVPGDDIRSIDWKVTARTHTPHIKRYREERELTVIVAADVSASTFCGTGTKLRERIIAKTAAVLSLIAQRNNDNVGLVTFSDRIEHYHPPRKARGAAWCIIHEVLTPGNYNARTDLGTACEFLSRVLKRRAIVFLISDFMTSDYELPLARLAARHDVTAIRVEDPADTVLPRVGLAYLKDPETGEEALVDTNNAALRAHYKKESRRKAENLSELFRQNKVGLLNLKTDGPFIDVIRKFFELKAQKRVA